MRLLAPLFVHQFFIMVGVVTSLVVGLAQPLLAVEMPETLAASLAKENTAFEDDMASVLQSGLKKCDKQRRTLERSYEKLQDSMINAGVVTGLREVQARLIDIQGGTQKTLFGDTDEVAASLVLSDLPTAAQTLENDHAQAVKSIYSEVRQDLNEARGDYVDVILKERKRLVKKGQLVEAEVLQTYLNEVRVEDYGPRLAILHKPACVFGSQSAPKNNESESVIAVAETGTAVQGPETLTNQAPVPLPADFWRHCTLTWVQLHIIGTDGVIQRVGVLKEFMVYYNAGTVDGLRFREAFKDKVPAGCTIESLSVSVSNGLQWADSNFQGASLFYNADTIVLNEAVRDRFLEFIKSGQKGRLNIN